MKRARAPRTAPQPSIERWLASHKEITVAPETLVSLAEALPLVIHPTTQRASPDQSPRKFALQIDRVCERFINQMIQHVCNAVVDCPDERTRWAIANWTLSLDLCDADEAGMRSLLSRAIVLKEVPDAEESEARRAIAAR